MPRKSSKPVSAVSSSQDFRRELRRGQLELFERCQHTTSKRLNVKWPGGYGKSLGIALAFRAMRERGTCDRLLLVVANDTQRSQALNDFAQDCADAGMCVPPCWRVTSDVATFRASEKEAAIVFVATIQQVSSSSGGGFNYILELMRHCSHRWMIAADEYHHYEEGANWGECLRELTDRAEFVLATSATPYRNGRDSIFGPPDMSISYQQAVDEGAVKPIVRRRYDYRIDYIDRDGQPVQFTSEELRTLAGSAAKIDAYEAKRSLRFSGKYVIPIVSEPIYRLRARRNQTGKPLQMLIRAMSCMHAEETCKQVRSICEDMTVDWIGTGPNGRQDSENDAIKALFCPRKDSRGRRPEPQLDILVQVGMADEGFDSVMVAEIVDLHIVSLEGASTKTKQFYKRGCRAVGKEALYINVGTDHPLAALEDNQVELWIDSDMTIDEAKEREPVPRDVDFNEWDIPDHLPETKERFVDAELTDMQIDAHPLFPKFRNDFGSRAPSVDELRDWFRTALHQGNEEIRSVSLEQQRKFIAKIVGQISHAALKRHGGEFERSRIGDYSKRINQRIIRQFGKRREEMLPDELATLYEWVKDLQLSIKNDEVPSWLR